MELDTELIAVTINGEMRQVPANQSVRELLNCLQIPHDRVAVEMNRSIVRRRDWECTPVEANAQIEIVEFVGGG